MQKATHDFVLAQKIGFGIIGCGGIAFDAHLPSLKEIPSAEVVAVSNRSEGKAIKAAEYCGISTWYTDNQKVIDEEGVDAVVICIPPNGHAEWTIKAAEAGKHVLCEKPMARSVQECDKMIEAAHRNKVKLMVAEMKRFNPGFRKVKELIDEGVIGDVFMVRYHNSYHEPHVRKAWWVQPEISGGGEMMNELTHQVNTLRWMIGEVKRVSALTNHPWGPPPEDNAVVSLEFEGGAIGVVTVSWMTKEYNFAFPAPLDHAWDEKIEIFGAEGSILIETPFTYWRIPLKLSLYTEKELPGYNKGWNFPRVPATNHYVAQIQHFIDCIRNDTESEVSGEEGRADLAVVRAAMESAETGRVVTLPK